MKIGFVGIGIMGHPMALNLIKGGHELFVYGKRRLPLVGRDALDQLPPPIARRFGKVLRLVFLGQPRCSNGHQAQYQQRAQHGSTPRRCRAQAITPPSASRPGLRVWPKL